MQKLQEAGSIRRWTRLNNDSIVLDQFRVVATIYDLTDWNFLTHTFFSNRIGADERHYAISLQEVSTCPSSGAQSTGDRRSRLELKRAVGAGNILARYVNSDCGRGQLAGGIVRGVVPRTKTSDDNLVAVDNRHVLPNCKTGTFAIALKFDTSKISVRPDTTSSLNGIVDRTRGTTGACTKISTSCTCTECYQSGSVNSATYIDIDRTYRYQADCNIRHPQVSAQTLCQLLLQICLFAPGSRNAAQLRHKDVAIGADEVARSIGAEFIAINDVDCYPVISAKGGSNTWYG